MVMVCGDGCCFLMKMSVGMMVVMRVLMTTKMMMVVMTMGMVVVAMVVVRTSAFDCCH